MDETVTPRANNQDEYSVFRFKLVPTLIMLCLAALIGWGISLIPDTTQIQAFAGVSGGIVVAICLAVLVNASGSRASVVIRALSMTLLAIGVVVALAMAIWCDNYRYYILVNGALLLIYAATVYRVATSGQ